MKATIINVKILDGIYVVTYESGCTKRFGAMPKTVGDWLTAHRVEEPMAKTIETVGPVKEDVGEIVTMKVLESPKPAEILAVSPVKAFEAPAPIVLPVSNEEAPQEATEAEEKATGESGNASFSDFAWKVAFKSLDVAYWVLGIWDAITIHGPSKAAMAWRCMAAILTALGTLGLAVAGLARRSVPCFLNAARTAVRCGHAAIITGAKMARVGAGAVRKAAPAVINIMSTVAGWVLVAAIAGAGLAKAGAKTAKAGWAMRSEIIEENKAA